MKWRSTIFLVFVDSLFVASFCGCNCSEEILPNDEEDTEIIRVINGYAYKSPDGSLIIKRCDNNFADCDDDPDNGCETDVRNNRNHCGTCSRVCINTENVSTAQCENLVCKIDYCTSGYVDLDGNYDNGCEYKCNKISDKEIGQNRMDDECDGIIDNICTYALDPNTYTISSDLEGGIYNLISAVTKDYEIVVFQVKLSDASQDLNLVILDSKNNVVSSFNVKHTDPSTDIGGVALMIYDDTVNLFWSENQGDLSKILYKTLNLNNMSTSSEMVLYEGRGIFTNLIAAEYKTLFYLSFELSGDGNNSVMLFCFDPSDMEVRFRIIGSTKGLDCYGHNTYFLDDAAYVSYWEMKGNINNLVVMKNDLISFDKERYPIYETNGNPGGTALSYGDGYFALMWTEQWTDLGSSFVVILNKNMETLYLSKTDFNYDELGLPVISYNGNIFGNTFFANKDNKYYILFSTFDISGKKIQELIISPVAIINKPFVSQRGDDFFIFYSDMNMKYLVNMRRVYCIKD